MRKLIILLFFVFISNNGFTASAKHRFQNDSKTKIINGQKCLLHKVTSKETWSSVSRKYNLSIEELKKVNIGVTDLKIGQIINVPILPVTSINKPTSKNN